MPEEYLIEYATTKISDGFNGEKVAYVEQLIWHENYDDELLINDIGLVKVKNPFEIDFSEFKVRLPIRGDYVASGTSAVLAGKVIGKCHESHLFLYETFNRLGTTWDGLGHKYHFTESQLANL